MLALCVPHRTDPLRSSFITGETVCVTEITCFPHTCSKRWLKKVFFYLSITLVYWAVMFITQHKLLT